MQMPVKLASKVPPFHLLDAWRGFAALWVVMCHSSVPYITTSDPGALRNPIFRFSAYGQLGVVLFFVISGYCITGAAYSTILSGRTLKDYAISRFRRIYPPYFVGGVATLAIGGLIAVLQARHLLPPFQHEKAPLPIHELKFWLANLTLTQAPLGTRYVQYVAWSLSYEVFFYVIIGAFLWAGALLFPVSPQRRVSFLSYASLATTLGSLAWLAISPSTCVFPLDRWYHFGFGSLLFLVAANGGRNASIVFRVSAACCVALCLYYAGFRASQVGTFNLLSPRLMASACLVCTGILMVLRPLDQRLSRWKVVQPLMWLGTFSYSIYLAHDMVIQFPDAALRRLGLVGSWYFVTFLAQLVVALGAGWVLFLLVERRFISKRIEVSAVESQRTANS